MVFIVLLAFLLSDVPTYLIGNSLRNRLFSPASRFAKEIPDGNAEASKRRLVPDSRLNWSVDQRGNPAAKKVEDFEGDVAVLTGTEL